jgi:hypothetical protein
MAAKQVRSAEAGISKRSRSRFSYLTDAGTTLATVFAYLNGELNKSLSQREGKQRSSDALLAFWKPYALQAQKANNDRVQRAAQSSVEALFRQIQAICDDFEVEMPIVRARTCVEERSASSDVPSTAAMDWDALAMPSEVCDALIVVARHIEKASARSQPLSTAIATDHFSKSQPVPQENDAIFVDDADLLGNLE